MTSQISNRPLRGTGATARSILLMCSALAGLIVCSVAVVLLPLVGIDPASTTGMYAALIAQDVLVFIVPAVAFMSLCESRSLDVMGITRAPQWRHLAVVMAVAVLSLPAMNWLVEWNKAMRLPEALAGLEAAMRTMEDQAEAATRLLLGGGSMGRLVANLLVVALMAGVGEECFFRGGLQTILTTGRVRTHVAIWITAIVFSAIHFQFFGFVPRMVLGAWLGYLLVRTGSLWVSIVAHALNNGMVVLATWLEQRNVIAADALDTLGLPADGGFPWLALASALTTLMIVVAYLRGHLDYGTRQPSTTQI